MDIYNFDLENIIPKKTQNSVKMETKVKFDKLPAQMQKYIETSEKKKKQAQSERAGKYNAAMQKLQSKRLDRLASEKLEADRISNLRGDELTQYLHGVYANQFGENSNQVIDDLISSAKNYLGDSKTEYGWDEFNKAIEQHNKEVDEYKAEAYKIIPTRTQTQIQKSIDDTKAKTNKPLLVDIAEAIGSGWNYITGNSEKNEAKKAEEQRNEELLYQYEKELEERKYWESLGDISQEEKVQKMAEFKAYNEFIEEAKKQGYTTSELIDYLGYRAGDSLINWWENMGTTFDKYAAFLGGTVKDFTGAKNPTLKPYSPTQETKSDKTLDKIWDSLKYGMQQSDRVLEDAAKENKAGKRAEKTYLEHINVAESDFGKAAGDLVGAVSYMAPTMVIGSLIPGVGDETALLSSQVNGLISQIPSAVLMGEMGYVDGYIEARNEGASIAQAKDFATREAINQGLGDMLIGGIGGIGEGLLSTGLNTITKGGFSKLISQTMGKLITNPIGRTTIKFAGNALGEGVEESLQSIVTTYNKKFTYDKNAKVVWKDVAYEGLIGAAMGGFFNIAKIKTNYKAYKADADVVNTFAKVAEKINTVEDVEAIREVGSIIVELMNETINDKSADENIKERAEFIKAGIESIAKTVDNYSEDIISTNKEISDCIEAIADSNVNDVVENTARLVDTVADSVEPSKDAVNATIDIVNEKIKDANSAIEAAQTESEKREAEIEKGVLEAIDSTLRNKKAEVEAARQKSEATQTTESLRATSDTVYEDLGLDNVRTAEDAADAIVRSTRSVNEAVDEVHALRDEYLKLNTEQSKAKLEELKAIDAAIRNHNIDRRQKMANDLKKSLAKYGITNIIIEDADSTGFFNKETNGNGWHDSTDGSIHLSPYLTTREAMYSVAAHELVHAAARGDVAFVSDLLKARSQLIEAGLYSGYGIERYRATYSKEIEGMSEAEAQKYLEEEMIGDFIRDLEKNGGEIIDYLAKNNRSLLQKIIDFFANLFDKTGNRAAYQLAEDLRKAYNSTDVAKNANALVDTKISKAVYNDGDGGVRFNLLTYEETGRQYLVDYLDKQVNSAKDPLDRADADAIIASLDEIYELCKPMTDDFESFNNWSSARVEVDENGNPVFSVIKANGDYAMNIDFSLVCKKRRTLDAVFNEMVRRGLIDKFDLGQDKVVNINKIIRDFGFEIACDACFVDAKRYRQAKVADDFVKMYNNLVKSMANGNDIAYFNFGGDTTAKAVDNGIDTMSDENLSFEKIDKILAGNNTKAVIYKIAEHLKNTPADRKLLMRGDFMSTSGFNAVKKNNPAVLSLYNSKKGSGGPKAAFGDVQYLSDIIKSGKFNKEAAYEVGGVRIQSFSDYVARLVFDYVQMVGDLAAKQLPAHAYTKEELFVKQFGLTGIKINMSLWPAVGNGTHAGLNADGSYAWADESFDFDTAVAIQNDAEYGKNCGTIAVGVSDAHIWKLLADDNIRMVIPYHPSGINPVVAKMNAVDKYTKYTIQQNTRYKDTGKKLSKEDMKSHFNFNMAMQNGMNAVEASKAYVEWCDENGYIPKFDKFAYNEDGSFNENYYKLLEDFTTMVNGEFYQQGAVKAVFPDENSAFGSMKSLIAEGLSEDNIQEGARSEKVGDIVDAVVDMLSGKTTDGKRYSRDVDAEITKSDIDILREIPRKSINEFTVEDIKKTEKWARKFYKELGVKSPFFRAWFGDWRANDNSVIPILQANKTEGKNPRGTFVNDDTGWGISSSSVGYDETISHSGRDKVSVRVMRSIDEVIKHSVLLDSEISEYGRGKKSSGTAFIHKFYALVRVDGKPYIAKMAVDESHMPNQDTYKKFYHVRAIEISPASSVGTGLNQIAHLLNAGDTNISIADLFELVKIYDSKFNPKTASKVVNKDGTPRVVYHWTNSDFTEFDPSRSGSNQGKTHGDGIYLSTSPDEFSYAGENQMMLYADIKNPFEMEMTEEEAERVYEKYAAPFHVDKFGLYKPHAMNALMSRYKVFDYLDEYASENKIKVSDILKEIGYDGVHDGTEWVAYEPTQVKSATDNSGAFDKNNTDIRYSRDIETEAEKTIRRQQERIEYLSKQLRSHTPFGWAKSVSPTARHNFAAEIASELPGISVDMVSNAVKGVWDVFEAAKKDASDTAESRVAKAAEKAREVAKELVENAVQTEVNPLYEQYNDLRVKLRTTPVKMNVSKAEFGGEADYRAWRSENKGLLRVSDSDSALPIDTYYQELSAQYPEFFPEDITDTADQLKRLGEVAVELKAIAGNKTEKVNPLEEVAESFTVDLANRILYGFDQLARVNPAAKHEYSALKNEQDVREAYASGTSDAAYREAEAYERGETAGKKRNEKEVQAALEREEIQRQIFERDFKKAQKNFNDGIERQNKRIYALERQIEQRSEKNRLTVARRSTLATLNRLNTMLMNPNRNKHVPQHLRAPVARLLASLGSTRLPNGKTVRASDMYAIDEAEYGRFEAESIRVADELKTVIDANKVSKDNAISNQFIDNLTRNIETLKQIYAEINPYSADDIVLPPNLADTRRIDYIKQVGKILNMVEHYIKDSNVVFLNHKAVSAREASERLINDLKMRKGKIDESGKASHLKEHLAGVGYEFLSADLAFQMIGESGVEIMQEYRRAQTMQANREQEFVDYIFKVTDGKYSTHAVGFTGELYPVTSNPNGPKATKSQIMQLYLTWKRPAGRRHLRNGGAIFTNELGQESKANTVQITQEIYNNLVSNLTEQDKLVADTIGKFLSRQCAEWGNEASMRMYGYRKFEDPSYFPLDVSKNALPSKWDSLDDFYKLENAGMTKSLKSNASSPLRMTDVFDIADYHVRTMAAYSAFAPVSNDVEKMMNMPGVAEAMNSGLGKKGVQYFETLMKSIASNKVRSGELADAAAPIQFLMNAYKRQAVAYNISTALKQPLSIVRALNEIEGKYVKEVPLVMSKAEYSRIYDTMLENSGVAKIKMLGFSDTGFGKSMRALYDKDYVNNAGVVRGALDKNKVGRNVIKAYDKFTDAGMWAAGKMDEITWVKIWRACELEVADKYVGLSKAEAIKKTADRFNQIIGRTQVVDTILDTAPIMKNKGMAILTPFMNEPVKALASIITAADAVKNGKPNAGKKLRKAVGLVLLNNLVLEPIISTLMTMWKDEEDDTENIADFCKKFLKVYAGVNVDEGFSFAEFMSSNVVGGLFSFPIIQIFYETFSDSMNNYSNEKIDTAAFSNLVNSAKNLVINIPKSKEDRSKSNYKLIVDFIGAASSFLGVPANTLRKQTSAMYRTAIEVTDSYDLQWEYNKMLYNLENGSARTQKGFYDILAAAYKDGDTEAFKMMLDDLTDVINDTPSAIKVDDIREAITDRGGEIEIGSDLWNVLTQARFYLPTYNSNMKVEKFLAVTYKDLEKASANNSELNPDKILLDMPSAPSYKTTNKDGERTAKPKKYDYTIETTSKKIESGKTITTETYEMSATGYEQYIADVGLLSYQVLREVCSTANLKKWTNLTAEQKEWAIQKIYDYSKRKYTKEFNTEYNIGSGGSWMEDLYKRNAGQVEIAEKILKEAKNKKFDD